MAKAKLIGYSVRARVISYNQVDGHYAVKLEATRLSFEKVYQSAAGKSTVNALLDVPKVFPCQ